MEVFMKSTLLAFLVLFLIIGCGRSSRIDLNKFVATSALSSKRSFEDVSDCSSRIIGEILVRDFSSANLSLDNYYQCDSTACRMNGIGELLRDILVKTHPYNSYQLDTKYYYCKDLNCRINVMSEMVDLLYTSMKYSNETSNSLEELRNCQTFECKFEKIGDVIAYRYSLFASNSSGERLVTNYFTCK
jgi:hypothetical protein